MIKVLPPRAIPYLAHLEFDILRLSWIKDGRKIAEDEDGIIVTTEGHLIIVSARLTDSGNFTCVAENLAGSRRSPPAEIVIYGGCKLLIS